MASGYALITYDRNPVGEFVESLRRELHPTTAHLAAHLTILPPRELLVDRVCGQPSRFQVHAVTNHDDAVEGQSKFGAVPCDD